VIGPVLRLPPVTVDRIAALLLGAAGVAEVVGTSHREGPPAANAAVALLYTLPFAWRRRHPVALLGCIFAGALTMAWALTPIEYLFVPLLLVLLAAYSCAAYQDTGRAGASLVLTVVGMVVVLSTMHDEEVTEAFFPAMFAVLAWLTGLGVRSRSRLTEALHEAAARAAEEHDESLRRAAADERRRIAREMHDLLAHSMSVMVVQAGGARRILARDPARALEAAERIERTGREALAEMRHLLGALTPGERARTLAPQPTLAELAALIGRARAAGLPAVLHECGERRALPAGVDLAAYRIVQEALTNALKHAGGAATEVTVTWAADRLALEIRDHGRGGRHAREGGHGLVGMRERVKLYGGELETGRPRGGGWRVRATLPLVREVAPA
jgi:signal transduction histidine kinase